MNEQTVLAIVHLFMVREHNRIARELGNINQHWEDEMIFQETRHIIAAIIQHITYNEWLPIVLGPAYMAELDILPGLFGHSNKYDSKVDPTIINSFATAAFRFGHTLIQGMLE